MQERTRFRLAMLKNSYWPVLNDCKQAKLSSWQEKRPDRDEILSWDRSTYLSTGMKIDDDLAVIDADIREKALINALIDVLDERYPELFVHGLVRHAGEVKQAWFVRTKEPFQRIYTRKWTRGDPDDPNAESQHVECFSSRTTRQFGVNGPHTREGNKIIRAYQFVDDASPATIPRIALPTLSKAAFTAACNLFEEIAQNVGLSVIKRIGNNGGEGKRVVYDLTDDMVFESGYDPYHGLEELAEACVVAEHEGYKLRVTSSFLGHGTNATKCIVGYSKGGRYVFVHDFETELTHKPANRAASTIAKFLEQLKGRSASG